MKTPKYKITQFSFVGNETFLYGLNVTKNGRVIVMEYVIKQPINPKHGVNVHPDISFDDTEVNIIKEFNNQFTQHHAIKLIKEIYAI